MTYQQLLPVYQQLTGLAGQDDAFNKWVQGIINVSGSQAGVEGIPDNFFQTPAGQQYIGQANTNQGAVPNGTISTTGTPGGFGQLANPVVPETGTEYTQATAPATGGNYNQVQNANQAGQFATVGQTLQQQEGTTGQTQNTAQNTQQNQTGTSNQTTNQSGAFDQNTAQNTNQQQTGTTTGTEQTTGTTQQSTTGTNLIEAIDTLGFGNLLKQQADSVGASDASRNAFLTDTMNTGGTGFASQIDAAIRNSLSGPQMTGAGDSARARAAGYASANVARNNLDQRLAAAQQLSGPTGLASLSTAANPYIGKSETINQNTTGTNNSTTQSTQNTIQNVLSSMTGNTSGTNTGTSNTAGTTSSQGNTATTGTSDMTGFSNMTSRGSEASAGSTTGQASQAGSGLIPQGQPVKTGGCVLCTAAIELKLSKHHRVLRRVIRHKLQVDSKRFSRAARGYFAVFTPLASWLLDHPRLAKLLFPVAKAVVYEELRIAGRRLPFKTWPALVHWSGHYFCATVDVCFSLRGYVADSRILDIAQREGILYELKGER